MSKFVSRLDKKLTNAFYEIEIDHETGLPVRVHVTVLTGRKGETKADRRKFITGGRHVAFHFEYTLSKFGEVEKLEIPREASRLLAKL